MFVYLSHIIGIELSDFVEYLSMYIQKCTLGRIVKLFGVDLNYINIVVIDRF